MKVSLAQTSKVVAFTLFLATAVLVSLPVARGAGDKRREDDRSGIEGVAMASPIQAGPERPGEVNARPLPGALLTVQPAGGGKELVRQRADAQGRFRIELAPGKYLLIPLPPQPGRPLPLAGRQTISVPKGKYVEL